MQKSRLFVVFLLVVTFCGYAQDESTFSSRKLRIWSLEGQKEPYWDVNEVVDVLVTSNANAIRYPVVGTDPGPHVYFNSKVLPKWPGNWPMGETDLLADLFDAIKKKGAEIEVIPYIQIGYSLSKYGYQYFPSWAAKDRDGIVLSPAGNRLYEPEKSGGVAICLNNPEFQKTYAELVKELVNNYELINGIYLDGPLWHSRVHCQCIHCRANWKSMFDEEMPENPFDSGKMQRKYVKMRGMAVENTARIVAEAAKSVRDVELLWNMGQILKSSTERTEATNLLPQVDGALVAELHRDRDLGGRPGFINGYMHMKTAEAYNKTGLAYCPPGPYWPAETDDDLEIKLWGLMQMVHKGTPLIEHMRPYLNDKTGIKSVNELFNHHQKYSSLYYDYQSVSNIALYFSNQNNLALGTQFDNNDSKIGRYFHEEYAGLLETLSRLQQQFTVVLDKDITPEVLNQYKMLILPDIAAIDDEKISTIKEYVRNGGSILATYRSSLFFPDGTKRDDFGLHDVFDVKSFPEIGEAICQGQRNVNSDWIIAGEYGKGRVIYVSQSIGKTNYNRGFPISHFIKNAIKWLSHEDILVQVANVPSSVIMNLTEKEDSRALHLINYSGENYESSLYRFEWVPKLTDITITLKNPLDKVLTRATLLSNGKSLNIKTNGSRTVITLPELKEYECILIDYSAASQTK